jgi:hypothetical protein
MIGIDAVRIVRVAYDGARGAFAGRVDVARGGVTFRYPCEVMAPQDADPAWVTDALAARAIAMSDSRLH